MKEQSLVWQAMIEDEMKKSVVEENILQHSPNYFIRQDYKQVSTSSEEILVKDTVIEEEVKKSVVEGEKVDEIVNEEVLEEDHRRTSQKDQERRIWYNI